jgi:hypothetical protein
MSKAPPNSATRISSFVLMIIFIALAMSLAALIAAVSFVEQNQLLAGYLLLLGFLGVALSTYVLFQTRRRILRLRIEIPPINTTVECKKCGFKNVREFQRGDYVFKEVDACQKCNEKMMITSIYREVKEKGKEGAPSLS